MKSTKPLEFKMKTLQLRLLLDSRRSLCQALNCSLNKDLTLDWGAQDSSSGSCLHFVLNPSSFKSPPDQSCTWIPITQGNIHEPLRKTLDFVSRLISVHPTSSATLSIVGETSYPSDLLAKETLQMIFKLFLAPHSLYLERSIDITLHDPKIFRSFAELTMLLYEQWRFNTPEPVIQHRDYRDLASFNRRVA